MVHIIIFINGPPDYDWSNLKIFLMDKRYWGIRLVNVAGYPEGTIMFNYLYYGPVQASIPIDVDGAITTELDRSGVHGNPELRLFAIFHDSVTFCVRIIPCLDSTGEGGTLHHIAASYLLSIPCSAQPPIFASPRRSEP